MRSIIGIMMVIFGLNTALTGIWNFFPPFKTEFYIPHVINACIFGLLAAVHVWLNRKPVLRYFKVPGWRWVLVGLGFVVIIYFGIIVPVFLW